jgi:hypothetical protein
MSTESLRIITIIFNNLCSVKFRMQTNNIKLLQDILWKRLFTVYVINKLIP